MDSLLDVVAGAIDPVLADSILQPAEQAQQQMVKDVTDDLTKIFAGIEMPARPNGAQIALQVIQQYTSQEDVALAYNRMKALHSVLRSMLVNIHL